MQTSIMKEINTNYILSLYEKYIADLKEARKYQKTLYSQKGYSWFESKILKKVRLLKNRMTIKPQLDDIEAEITYLLIREYKPKTIVEISPCAGWSTSWILNALKDNSGSHLYSYDLIDDSSKMVPPSLSDGSWTFFKCDIRGNLDKLPQKIDYLFIDSDHSADFAYWYIHNLFPRLEKGVPISVHDVFHKADPDFDCEGRVIINWLEQNNIGYSTASPAKEKVVFILTFCKTVRRQH